jgi:hypothetical protein
LSASLGAAQALNTKKDIEHQKEKPH